MQKYNLTKYQDSKNLLSTIPKKEHYNKVIENDTMFFLNGECIGIYINVAQELLHYVRQCVKETKYVETYRTCLLYTSDAADE